MKDIFMVQLDWSTTDADGIDTELYEDYDEAYLPCGRRQRCRKTKRSSRFYGKSLCVLHYRQQRYKLAQISGLCCGELEIAAKSRQVHNP